MPTKEDAAAPCVLRRIIWQQRRQRGGPKKRGYPPGFFKKSNDLPRLIADKGSPGRPSGENGSQIDRVS